MFLFTRPFRDLAATMACVALLAVPAASAEATSPGPPDCPVGFPGVMTLADALVRYEGYYTVEEIHTGFASHDLNGNGFWVLQAGTR